MCYLSVVSGNASGEKECWLGQPFFRQYLVMFDYELPAVSVYSKGYVSPIDPVGPVTSDVMTYAATVDNNGYYYTDMYVGTPAQKGTNIAISTGSVENFVPAQSCISCPDDWYSSSASSTYVASTAATTLVSSGIFGAACESPSDVFTNPTSQSVTLQFCEVTFAENNLWSYNGALGLGLPSDKTECQAKSLPCAAYVAYQIEPAVTFVFTSAADTTSFSIGTYDVSKMTLMGKSITMPNSPYWSLNVTSMTYDTTSSTNSNPYYPSVLDSAFPFITLPAEAWAAYNKALVANDFICIKTAYQEVQKCLSKDSCTSFSKMDDLVIEMNGITPVTLTPSDYLTETDDGCLSLLTEADPLLVESEWSRLGTPFFRQAAITLNYYERTIALYSS